MKAAGFNPNSLAKRLGEDAPLINKIVNNKRDMSERLMELIASLPEFKLVGLTEEMMREWKGSDKSDEIIAEAMTLPEDRVAQYVEKRLGIPADDILELAKQVKRKNK